MGFRIGGFLGDLLSTSTGGITDIAGLTKSDMPTLGSYLKDPYGNITDAVAAFADPSGLVRGGTRKLGSYSPDWLTGAMQYGAPVVGSLIGGPGGAAAGSDIASEWAAGAQGLTGKRVKERGHVQKAGLSAGLSWLLGGKVPQGTPMERLGSSITPLSTGAMNAGLETAGPTTGEWGSSEYAEPDIWDQFNESQSAAPLLAGAVGNAAGPTTTETPSPWYSGLGESLPGKGLSKAILPMMLAGGVTDYISAEQKRKQEEEYNRNLSTSLDEYMKTATWTDEMREKMMKGVTGEYAGQLTGLQRRLGAAGAEAGRGGGAFYGKPLEQARQAGREGIAKALASTYGPSAISPTVFEDLAKAKTSPLPASASTLGGISTTMGQWPYLMLLSNMYGGKG